MPDLANQERHLVFFEKRREAHLNEVARMFAKLEAEVETWRTALDAKGEAHTEGPILLAKLRARMERLTHLSAVHDIVLSGLDSSERVRVSRMFIEHLPHGAPEEEG